MNALKRIIDWGAALIIAFAMSYFATPAHASLVNAPFNSTPNFQAYTSVSRTLTGTAQAIGYDTVVYDSCGCYNTSTFTYTPNVSGKYRITFANSLSVTASSVNMQVLFQVYKNGVSIGGMGPSAFINSTIVIAPTFSMTVQMNGTTDNLKIEGSFAGGTSALVNPGTGLSFWQVEYIGQ